MVRHARAGRVRNVFPRAPAREGDQGEPCALRTVPDPVSHLIPVQRRHANVKNRDRRLVGPDEVERRPTVRRRDDLHAQLTDCGYRDGEQVSVVVHDEDTVDGRGGLRFGVLGQGGDFGATSPRRYSPGPVRHSMRQPCPHAARRARPPA